MHTEFDKKTMVDVQIALLTHKMSVTFESSVFIDKTVTPEGICDEVEMIGFGCELLNVVEVNRRDPSSIKKRRTIMKTDNSESDDK
jgi:hypothetical protein